MPSAVSKWIHKKFGERKGKSSIPVLPEIRQRPITPTESCHTGRLNATLSTVGNGPFFQKLPPEIRHQILAEAFGYQTIHMDLFYEHPMQAQKRDGTLLPTDAEDRHCGLNVAYDTRSGRLTPRFNRSKPKHWIWRSSVCHRDFPGRHRRLPGHQIQPCDDLCRFGDSMYNTCQHWSGEAPSKCFVGIMGWLLSCRQA